MMSGPNLCELAHGATQIHVVARDEHAPAPSTKCFYTAAVFVRQAVTDIYREQP